MENRDLIPQNEELGSQNEHNCSYGCGKHHHTHEGENCSLANPSHEGRSHREQHPEEEEGTVGCSCCGIDLEEPEHASCCGVDLSQTPKKGRLGKYWIFLIVSLYCSIRPRLGGYRALWHAHISWRNKELEAQKDYRGTPH